MDLETKVNQLQVEIGALKEKVSFFSVIYDKFDSTLEKLQEMIEERRNDTNNDLRDVYKKINDTENKIMDQIERLREEMAAQHAIEKRKIDEINKWRWIVIGGAAVVGWFVSKVANFIAYK